MIQLSRFKSIQNNSGQPNKNILGRLINIFLFPFICFCVFMLGSCNAVQTNKTLIDDVTILNDSCPISAGKIGELQSVEIKDSCVVLHYYLTEEFKQIAWERPSAAFDARLQYLEIAMLDTTNLKSEPLTKLYFDAFKSGYSIRNEYHFKFETGVDAEITNTLLTPKVFYEKYLNGNMKQLCAEALKIREANENSLYESMNLPDSLRAYDRIEDKMFVIGSYVSANDFLHVWFNQFDLQKNLSKAFKDQSMISFAKQCILCDKGISFRYISSARKDSICVDFSKKELESLLTNYDGVMETYKQIEEISKHSKSK